MFFRTLQEIDKIREEFKALEILGKELKSGDDFFSKFGPGNVIQTTDKPFERFSDYEELLCFLEKDNTVKYKQIHKGTPFYFLAWTALDMRNYEKALFYMDAAISEDIINQQKVPWINCSAGSFVTLNLGNTQSAPRVGQELKQVVVNQFTKFNAISGRPEINLNVFVSKFVTVLVADAPKRSIVTSLYTFILEFEDRFREIQLRSKGGGSIEPFLTHLFKGGLIFESLLKHLYPVKDDNKPAKTLGDIFQIEAFKRDFFDDVKSSAISLEDILKEIKHGFKSAFDTTSRIRNTTGHNLVWNDIFNEPKNYELLFEQEMKAILYIISLKYI
jgi:hypothetical protein